MDKFSVSILLPVLNETFSLKQTVDTIAGSCSSYIVEFIIVYCRKTNCESLKVINELQARYGALVFAFEQKRPFLGGAFRDAFEICKGTHVVVMSSDLETDPALVEQFILNSKKEPQVIFTATRWNGGSFVNYHPVKLIFNFIFQKIFALLYHTNLSDLTFGFRIFPVNLVKSIEWKELRHPFLLETLLIPLRMGVKVKEIPTSWIARKDGTSANPFFSNFRYIATGIRIRFCQKKKLLMQQA